jgi:hypothetical protein
MSITVGQMKIDISNNHYAAGPVLSANIQLRFAGIRLFGYQSGFFCNRVQNENIYFKSLNFLSPIFFIQQIIHIK